MLRYADVLEERYDSVAQIVKAYALPTSSGKTLDPLFFEDMPITKNDRQAFQQWFVRECGLRIVDTLAYDTERIPASRLSAVPMEADRTVVKQSTGSAELRDFRTMSSEEWLLDVSPDGAVLGYKSTLDDCYDTVAQVVRTYVAAGPKNGRDAKTLDPQFFADLEINTEQHQRLFRRWFFEQCGAGDPSAPDAALHSTKASSSSSSRVAVWLANNGLEDYVEALEHAGYDDLKLLADLRPNEVEEMLDIASVMKPGHRAKFRRAVEDIKAIGLIS